MILRKKILVCLMAVTCTASVSMAQTVSENNNATKIERPVLKKSKMPVRARASKRMKFGATSRIVDSDAKNIDSAKVVTSPASRYPRSKNKGK